MFSNSSFGKTMDILQKSMDVSLLRRDVIANNMANAETPNFKRSEVSFESELKRVLASEGKSSFQHKLIHEKHFEFMANKSEKTYSDVQSRVDLDYLSTVKNNGNNVDAEEELMKSTQNEMMYSLMTEAVSHQFRSINMVIG